jgi:hypothetical protein
MFTLWLKIVQFPPSLPRGFQVGSLSWVTCLFWLFNLSFIHLWDLIYSGHTSTADRMFLPKAGRRYSLLSEVNLRVFTILWDKLSIRIWQPRLSSSGSLTLSLSSHYSVIQFRGGQNSTGEGVQDVMLDHINTSSPTKNYQFGAGKMKIELNDLFFEKKKKGLWKL